MKPSTSDHSPHSTPEGASQLSTVYLTCRRIPYHANDLKALRILMSVRFPEHFLGVAQFSIFSSAPVLRRNRTRDRTTWISGVNLSANEPRSFHTKLNTRTLHYKIDIHIIFIIIIIIAIERHIFTLATHLLNVIEY